MTKLKIESFLPDIEEYIAKFGHMPSIEALKFQTEEELAVIAKEAIEKGEPVLEWKNRPTTKTGSTLDKAYGLSANGE